MCVSDLPPHLELTHKLSFPPLHASAPICTLRSINGALQPVNKIQANSRNPPPPQTVIMVLFDSLSLCIWKMIQDINIKKGIHVTSQISAMFSKSSIYTINQIKSNFICTAHFIPGGNTMRLTEGKNEWGVTNTCKKHTDFPEIKKQEITY